MRKLVGSILAGALLAGCLIGRHGHVALIPPPELLVAGAIAASIAAQPGQVWVEGHWDWVGGRWVWSQGFWIADRPGLVWTQGVWLHGHAGWYWRPGHWRHR
jgi:hypothetical protein